MRLTESDVAKFRLLYKEELGLEITPERALAEGLKLLSFVSLISQPMNEDDRAATRPRRNQLLPLLTQLLTDETQQDRPRSP